MTACVCDDVDQQRAFALGWNHVAQCPWSFVPDDATKEWRRSANLDVGLVHAAAKAEEPPRARPHSTDAMLSMRWHQGLQHAIRYLVVPMFWRGEV